MSYPPTVYPNQDDLSRFHLAQQRGYGVSPEYLHTSPGASNSRTEQDKSLRFNSWCLPLESPLANSLTDDDFLEMVVAYLLVTYAENFIPLRPLVLELDIFCKSCCLVESRIVMTHYWKLGENICSIFQTLSYFSVLFLIHNTYISQCLAEFCIDVTGTSFCFLRSIMRSGYVVVVCLTKSCDCVFLLFFAVLWRVRWNPWQMHEAAWSSCQYVLSITVYIISCVFSD
jgi:hypothetical protein